MRQCLGFGADSSQHARGHLKPCAALLAPHQDVASSKLQSRSVHFDSTRGHFHAACTSQHHCDLTCSYVATTACRVSVCEQDLRSFDNIDVLLRQSYGPARLTKIYQRPAPQSPAVLGVKGLSIRQASVRVCSTQGPLCSSLPRTRRFPTFEVATCGPNRSSGRFRRVHTDVHLPEPQPGVQPGDSTGSWPVAQLSCALFLLLAAACSMLPGLRLPPSHQRGLVSTQANVAWVTQRPNYNVDSNTAVTSPIQQQAFASISGAGFASIWGHSQRMYVAQMLVYQAQRLLTMNIMTKLVSVILLSLPFIGIGGFLYKKASGSTWREALFKSYVVLQNVPGADATVEPNYKAALVVHSIFQLGLLTFAVVLGVVCNDISAAVESIQSGNYAVVESGHTVILNWNKLTIPILRQMAVARAEHQEGTFRGPVVVLADMDKAEMDAAVAKGLQGRGRTIMEVLTRSGCPHNIADLEKAAAGRAKIVVMLHPEDAEGAAQRKVAAITGIESLGGGAKAGQNLLIQSGPESTEGDALLTIATQAAMPKHMNLGLIEMKDQERMDRLISQCAVQPGLGKVYSQILLQSHTSAEFYLKDMFPSLVGRPYAEARRSFDNAVLCGVLDTKTGQAQLNPSDDCMLDNHHRLVFLSSTAHVKPSRQAVSKASTKAHVALPAAASHASSQKLLEVRDRKDIVVVGWHVDQTVEVLVQGLGDFAPPDSEVTIVSPEEPESLPSNCRCQHVEGSIASRQALLEAGVAEADAVILRMPLQSLADNDADAQVVASLIQLQDLALESGRTRPLHVVAQVRHPRTIKLINYITTHRHNNGSSDKAIGAVKAVTDDHSHHHVSHGSSQAAAGHGVRSQGGTGGKGMGKERGQGVVLDVDVLLPDELLSGLLTQVSVQPELLSVMNDLFDAEGAEIYLRHPSRYSLTVDSNTSITFSAVAEAARQQHETALGYILQDGTVMSAPHADQKQALNSGDQIIVLADQA